MSFTTHSRAQIQSQPAKLVFIKFWECRLVLEFVMF